MGTVVMFDCCHSGTLIDLPYQCQERYDIIKKRNVTTDWKLVDCANCFGSGKDYRGKCGTCYGTGKAQQSKNEDPFVLYLSACKDTETANESMEGDVPGAVLTVAFQKIINECGYKVPLKDLIDGIHQDEDVKKFRMTPRLSCSHNIDMNHTLSDMIDGNSYTQLALKLKVERQNCLYQSFEETADTSEQTIAAKIPQLTQGERVLAHYRTQGKKSDDTRWGVVTKILISRHKDRFAYDIRFDDGSEHAKLPSDWISRNVSL